MKGTGRQKAGEIKRRIIRACEEAGLTVQAAKFYLRREHDDRIVQVTAVSPDGPLQRSVIDIRTVFADESDRSGVVEIACYASEDNPGLTASRQTGFILRGREHVPLSDLAVELRKTVEEREQVLAAHKMGVEGPYRFGKVCWERL